MTIVEVYLAPTPVSQWVIDSFRFGDSYRISELVRSEEIMCNVHTYIQDP